MSLMENNLRFRVVEEAFKKKALDVEMPKERPSEYFGKYVFDKHKISKYLSKEVFKKLLEVVEKGFRLDTSIADEVAQGMKKWAIEMGANHYTHWFQPLTEGTAEKHGRGGFVKLQEAH